MLKKGKGFEIDWVELPIVLMLATDLDLVEVSMNFSHMDHEYEKIRRRMNPPSVVDNEACKNAMVIRECSPNRCSAIMGEHDYGHTGSTCTCN
ncbi:ACT domain-containing protein ACR4-like [Rosa rugosa]|uniref:ACT domain-containing protein ACR4-like n=1 Tax=Rosa rugosa TaxID=74645 RepID=UPI002B40A310|nr:ACT domain-containing protein ACR4-like [Rosa rugosa]